MIGHCDQTTIVPHRLGQSILTRMTKRRVPQIMSQFAFPPVFIKPQRTAIERAIGATSRVGQPCPVVISFVTMEDRSFVFKPTERRSEQFYLVSLKAGKSARFALRFSDETSAPSLLNGLAEHAARSFIPLVFCLLVVMGFDMHSTLRIRRAHVIYSSEQCTGFL